MNKFYSIKSSENFFKVAVKMLLDKCYDQNNPHNLAKTQVWVPSSRIAQSLKNEITNQLNSSAILPDIKTVSFNESEIETVQFYNSTEDFIGKKFLSPSSKLLYFAKAINMAMTDWTFQQCFNESISLVKLHQDLQNYDVSLEQLVEAVPYELAQHWEKNLELVKAVFIFYDRFLDENNKQDKYVFQNKLIDLFIQKYDDDYTNDVFAIGFTDTTKLGKKILSKIKDLKNSTMIFPYIDKNINEYEISPSHVHYALNSLLTELAINPKQISYLGEDDYRLDFLNSMFSPAKQTYKWFENNSHVKNLDMTIINAENIQQEAKAVALIMRESLVDSNKTCALISPNRLLAQSVIQQLKKWDINVNDSAGIPLSNNSIGQLALNLCNVVLEDYSIDEIIPLVTNKSINKEFDFDYEQSLSKFIKIGVLGSNIDDSLKALKNKINQTYPWVNRKEKDEDVQSANNIFKLLKLVESKLNTSSEKTIPQWVNVHLNLMLEFINDEVLFADDAGKILAEVFTELKDSDNDTLVDLKTYYQTFKLISSQTMVRKVNNLHPRLFVWGSPEARLQNIDRVIISDFNDGTWPGKIKSSLWLNPSIRKQLNMPDISVSAGLNANDLFMQILSNEVYITRSKKDDMGDTVPSRFLIRLKNSLIDSQYESFENAGDKYLKLLDSIEKQTIDNYLKKDFSTEQTNVLTLSNGLRLPDYISASSVKDLANCPYKFYLSKVMFIKEFEDTQDVAPNILGQTVHLILELFFKGINEIDLDKLHVPLSADKYSSYYKRMDEIIDYILNQIDSEIIQISWANKLKLIGKEFIKISVNDLSLEIYTEKELKANGFSAIVDRLDLTIKDDTRGYNIIDYKTGKPPSRSDILSFKDPQLIVESYILEKQGKQVVDLNYWHTQGYGAKPIKVTTVAQSSKSKVSFEELKAQSYQTLEQLQTHFKKADVEFHPHNYGTTKLKDSVCKYCPYSGICRKFSL